jgi:hypothetical protein
LQLETESEAGRRPVAERTVVVIAVVGLQQRYERELDALG